MIVFATTTDITNPGREFGYSDKLTQQLREVGDMPQTQDSRLTFGAGIGFLGFDVFFLTHLIDLILVYFKRVKKFRK